jgi:PadR family transcriptional regulator, regulatory protein PadR
MLGLIRLGEGSYGVSIARKLELQTGREIALTSVYAALERLGNQGYVTSVVGDPTPEPGDRAKRSFYATKKGLREVGETRRTLTKLWAACWNYSRGTSHEDSAGATNCRVVIPSTRWGEGRTCPRFGCQSQV